MKLVSRIGEPIQYLLLESLDQTWKQGPEAHSKDAWLHGGGSTWVTGTYDEDSNTIFGGSETLVLIGIMNIDQAITYTATALSHSMRILEKSSGIFNTHQTTHMILMV